MTIIGRLGTPHPARPHTLIELLWMRAVRKRTK